MSQVGPVSGLNLEKMVYQSTVLAMKRHQLANDKQQLVAMHREKYKDYISGSNKLVSSRFRDRGKKQQKRVEDYFNKMIFTDDWIRFKTFFGHKKLEIDPEDNMSTFI